jgi:hypothetical protein
MTAEQPSPHAKEEGFMRVEIVTNYLLQPRQSNVEDDDTALKKQRLGSFNYIPLKRNTTTTN